MLGLYRFYNRVRFFFGNQFVIHVYTYILRYNTTEQKPILSSLELKCFDFFSDRYRYIMLQIFFNFFK
uniref:Uncharacterized protein n=1 Tax=Pararge aegeria TaxID=116150 RepID=S4PRX4_9NEOP